MYVVRIRTAEGTLKEKAVFSDVRSALRHMDSYIEAFPHYASELEGAIGILTRYEPLQDEMAPLSDDGVP